MKTSRVPHPVPDPLQRIRRWVKAAAAAALVATQVTPAHATIDNTATATGTAPDASSVTDDSNQVQVPVAPASATLTVDKTAGSWVDVDTDNVIEGGDTVTYTYLITNTGNVTINDAVPVDGGPTFNSVAGTGSMGAFTLTVGDGDLSPGETATYTAVYTLSDADAFRAAGISAATGDAVENSATATGDGPGPIVPTSNTDSVEIELPADPLMTVAKSFVLVKAPANNLPANVNLAEVGDTINYTYVVNNDGNVTLTGVSIDDVHEGSSLGAGTIANETLTSDGALGNSADEAVPVNNGTWVTMGAGAVVTFTYSHTVTLTEFEGQ
jgi:uncharacterized repeat protein (TIGR01451 family)